MSSALRPLLHPAKDRDPRDPIAGCSAAEAGIVYDPQTGALSLPELDLFLGPNYLVTFHHSPVDAAQRLWEDCRKDRRLLQYGPAYLLYRLLDELIVDYMAAVDELEDALGELEDRVLERPEVAFHGRILRLKRIVLRLRRVVTLQRELFGPALAELAPWTAGAAFVATLAVLLLLPAAMFFWMRRWAWM